MGAPIRGVEEHADPSGRYRGVEERVRVAGGIEDDPFLVLTSAAEAAVVAAASKKGKSCAC